jgi:putative RNA 2'-phosphotransferase
VGKRYGKPVVLQIGSLAMFHDGHRFFLSDNKVWLTDHVPVNYIEIYKL